LSAPEEARRPEREGISCFIVCQDEEAQIGPCLESVQWCDEVIVVDGGSRDRTFELAVPHATHVIRHDWPGYVEQKRFAFAQTTQSWVLNVDADERVSPGLRDEILTLLKNPPQGVNGFYIRRLVFYLGRWWFRGPFYPGWRLRLVRRDQTSWGGTNPHDKALVRGRTKRLQEPLLHYTYNDISDHLASINRLTDVAAGSQDASVHHAAMILRPAWRFAWTYSFAGGIREGFAGLFVCMTAAFYVFLRLAKRAERRLGGVDG
jgi:(heptosyl)LPS beta-1,4-glucosyltransferase